jgi:hypothetical protein
MELVFDMDVSGITTFFTTLLDTGVKIAGLVAAVSLAAAGFMYFGVVGHNQGWTPEVGSEGAGRKR